MRRASIQCNEALLSIASRNTSERKSTKMIYDRSYRAATVCTAVTGTMTMALKAQRALTKAAIPSNTVKVSKSANNTGCIYGVEFNIALLGNARATLDSAGIEVKEYLR